MDSPHTSADLAAFRDSLYRCFGKRADALFEPTDAILAAGPQPSPAHLSLEAAHRRGWGSLYAAEPIGCETMRWGSEVPLGWYTGPRWSANRTEPPPPPTL